MRVVGLVQARMGSSRLPGKVARQINGLPLFWHVYRRLLGCRSLDQVVVSAAMERAEESTALEEACNKYSMYYHFGSSEDLLERHLQAGAMFNAEAIVRVTADCLFHDPRLIDDVIERFRAHWPYYRAVSNWTTESGRKSRSWSEGVDCEIYSMDLLGELRETQECPREDFAAYVFGSIDRWKAGLVSCNLNDGDVHLSIDTEEDVKQAEVMLKILGNNEWRYEKTMEAHGKIAR